jgi:hypothetical protein
MARVFLSPKVVSAPIYLYHPGGEEELGGGRCDIGPPTLAGEPRRPELARAGDLRVSWGDLLAHDSTPASPDGWVPEVSFCLAE